MTVQFHSRLRHFRQIRGLSQQKIASTLGVGQTTYQLWEKNSKGIKFTHLYRLGEALGIPAGMLISEIGGAETGPVLRREFYDCMHSLVEEMELVLLWLEKHAYPEIHYEGIRAMREKCEKMLESLAEVHSN